MTKKYNHKKNIAGVMIKEAREKKKMTKVELSKKLELYSIDINTDELLLIEKNQLLIKDFELAALSVVLDIDLNNLKNHLDQ